MRCLALADVLAKMGAECHFICRNLPGFRGSDVRGAGHKLTVLPAPVAQPADHGPYSQWLGVPMVQDARETFEILDKTNPDWVVVDHYALAQDWAKAAIPDGPRILAIDELANRTLCADILLCPSPGPAEADYGQLLPPHCQRLVGPKYALLRPEFADYRDMSEKRRQSGGLGHIVISLGGVDIDNITSRVLRALRRATLPDSTVVTVVLGAASPHLEAVEADAENLGKRCNVVQGISNMAELLTDADMAIGAAGGSGLERCCLGVPSLLLVLADNQKAGAHALEAAGAAILLGDARQPGWEPALHTALVRFARPSELSQASENALQVCSGQGARIVANALMTSEIVLRNATEEDARPVWEWRHADDALQYYSNPAPIPFTDHSRWFASALQGDQISFYIALRNNTPVGYVRLDRSDKDKPLTRSVSICMAPEAKGKGLAGHCLSLLVREAVRSGSTRLLAVVHKENAASLRLFKRAGFGIDRMDGSFVHQSLDLIQPQETK